MTKVRYFLKGARFMAEVVLVFLCYELVKTNEEQQRDLDELKSNRRPCGPAPYSYKKHPKGGLVKPEEPKNPIGFGEYHD